MSDVILEGRGLSKRYRSGFGFRSKAVLSGRDIQLHQEETLAIMGPSGCGKSTLARILMRLIDPDEGQILFHGEVEHMVVWFDAVDLVIEDNLSAGFLSFDI